MNESCHTYEWVMSHIWMSHVTHMNESRHTYEWVMSHIWTHHIWMDPVTCYTRLHCMTLLTYDLTLGSNHIWIDSLSGTPSLAIQDCIHSHVTCMTPFICHVTLRPHHTWMDPFTCQTGLVSLTRRANSRVTSHRLRMEKSHSNHHELLVCSIVSILMALKVQQTRVYLHYCIK